jgi:hypothetical protein
MPNWKKVIVSGSDAALNSLNVTTSLTASGLIYPTTDGTVGQSIVTDGAGNLSFSSPGSTNTTITIKNVSGGTIQKGTPCYITGSGTSGNLAGVFPADASNPLRMPAGVIAGETLNNGDEGIGLINGFINGVDTSAFAAGDSIYVAAGGGYTNVRPTGSTIFIQKLGNVEKSAINGSGVINGPAYYNEVPNIQQGYTWVGNSNGVATPVATSSIQNVVSSSYALTASYTPSIAGTDNYIPKFNGSSALENSVMYDDGTNIGIGTTSPGWKLDVSGLINAITTPGPSGTIIRVRDTVTGGTESFGGVHFTSSPGTDYTIGKWTTAAGAGLLQVRDQSGNPFMTINSAGNVGIGTTNPGSYDTAIIGSGHKFLNVQASSTNYAVQTLAGNSGTDGNRLGYLTFVNDNNNATYKYSAWIGSEIEGTTANKQGGRLIFSTTSDNSAAGPIERMRITSAGNVGIGTTSPSSILQLGAGSYTATNSSYNSFNAGSFGVLFRDAYDSYIAFNTVYGASGWVNKYSSYKSAVLNFNDGALDISTGTGTTAGSASNLSTKLVMTNDGNVGIGTSSPNTTLDVNGNSYFRSDVRIGPNFTGPSTAIFKWQGGGTDSLGIFTWGDGKDIQIGGSNTIFAAEGGAERMRIASNGAIKFNAYGSGTFTGTATQKLAVDSSGNVIEIPIGAGPVDGSGTANYITRWVDTDTITTSSIYETGGNIGIGITSPSYKLSINGSAGIEASEEYFYFHSTYSVGSNARAKIRAVGAGGGSGYGGDFRISTRATNNTWNEDAVTVDSSGNVGIGTTTPSAPLHIFTSDISNSLHISGYPSSGNPLTFLESNYGALNAVKLKFLNYNPSNGYDSDFGIQLMNTSQVMNDVFIIKGSTGNVGIGTTTPAYKLSVVGKIALNDGGNSVFIGDNAGLSDDATANINVGIGQNALQNNIVGNQNVAVGNNTLVANTNSNNTAVGSNSLQFNTTGFNNTGIGSYALNANIDGVSNTALGPAALLSNTSGSRNIAVGSSAARLNTSGSRNISIGTAALYENVTGSNNVAIGDNAGRYFGSGTSALTNASGSIFLGNNTRANANGSLNEIVIGTDLIGLGSNTVILGNDNITTTALKGNVGIGTTSPLTTLHLSATSPILSFTATGLNRTSTIGMGDGANFYIKNTTDGNLYISDYNSVYIAYGASSQNVGIGTTSPTQKLEVNGNIKLSSTAGSTSTPSYIWLGNDFSNGTTRDKLKVYLYNSGTDIYGFTVGSTGDIQYHSNVTHDFYIDNALATRINSTGVGIGTSSPSYKLDVNGTARVTTLIETSALKYKTNIQPLEPQLSKVTQLEPVTFDWLDKPQTKTNIGLIADEVEKIYPEFVSKTEDGEIEGIEYSKLTTVLIQSIKELKEIVDQQQAQINKLLSK